MTKKIIRGVLPALPTPFDRTERLIPGTVEKLMDFGYRCGVHGYYVGGATGEGPVLPVATRIALCEAAVEANRGRGQLILHIGGPNFSDVQELIRHADAPEITAISAMAPNAYYPHSDAELVAYYKSIAALTDKPLLIYVTNLMLGNHLDRVFGELMQVDNIIGLKYTQPNYYPLSLLAMLHGGDINLINGPDETLLCGLAMGADGGIGTTYNIMPEKFAALYQAFRAGEIDRAREIQWSINRIIRVLLEFGDGIACIKNVKSVLSVMLDCDMGDCAFPAAHLDAEAQKTLLRQLHDAGWSADFSSHI